MELKANELRIGNLVQTNQGVFKVTKISQNEIDICPFLSNEPFSIFINTVKPIPLTEEWLLKFGFENIRFKYEINNFIIWLDPRSTYYYLMYEGRSIKIKHVHQLQNIFFALTGKELEIKM